MKISVIKRVLLFLFKIYQPLETKLSVNINKIALLRNGRGGNVPDVLTAAAACVRFGAAGITVHPRPDERHIRRTDVYALAELLRSVPEIEFNIEGYPTDSFLEMITDVRPAQCTLVPDPPEALTSNTGWDTIKRGDFLREFCEKLQKIGVRSSLFINPDEKMITAAAKLEADRIELYTGPYAHDYVENPELAVTSYRAAAICAAKCGLGVNAGHDLSLTNLNYFVTQVPNVLEVSIGHALISDALYLGLESTIKSYLNEIKLRNKY